MTTPLSLNLQTIAQEALRRQANCIAVSCEGRDYDWGWMNLVATRLESALVRAKVARAAPICLIARSQAVGAAAFLTLIAESRSISSLYSYQSPAALAHNVRVLKPAAVVAHAEDWTEPLTEAVRECGAAGVSLQGDGGVECINEVDRGEVATEPTGLEPFVEILTSGTTGLPKRHRLSFRQLKQLVIDGNLRQGSLFKANQAAELVPAQLSAPLGNISGVFVLLLAIAMGRRVLMLRKFNLPDWIEHVRKYRVGHSTFPPAAVKMLMNTNLSAADFPDLKYITIGMGPVDPELRRQFESRFEVAILPLYGATEFAGTAAEMTPALHAQFGESKFGSAGRAILGVRLRVRNPETGELLAPGESVGLLEVQVDGIGPDWIKTTDLARIDEDGFLFVLGRADGVINRGGFKIHPISVETALGTHASVADACVVGVPDPRLGAVPVAAVQLRKGVPVPSHSELEAHLRALLPATHIPVAFRFVEALPLTPSFKVSLEAVRGLFKDLADQIP